MTASLDVIVGGQFGSESKGRVTLQVAQRYANNAGTRILGIRVAGPNAGHVVYDKGRRWAMRQVPVLFPIPDAELYIAPGSEIDPHVLMDEVRELEHAGYRIRDRLLISPEATIISTAHQHRERDLKSGTTGKGVGAARADRIMRQARIVKDLAGVWVRTWGLRIGNYCLNEEIYYDDNDDLAIVIEGTQGFGLGQHAGYYPYCTSSDCRAIDFLAMAGVSPWALRVGSLFSVHMVVRTHPIRIAGNSGPLPGETSWAELGLETEYTTVTKKERRVGEFNLSEVKRAIEANGISNVRIHLAMMDHVVPEIAGMTSWDEVMAAGPDVLKRVRRWMDDIDSIGAVVYSLGTGPETAVQL